MPFIGTAATPCFPFHLPEQESAGRGPCEMPAESRGLSRRPTFPCCESGPARLHRTARYRRRKMRCLALPVPICQSALFLIVFHAARTCGCRGRSAHAVPDAVRSRCRHVCSGEEGRRGPGKRPAPVSGCRSARALRGPPFADAARYGRSAYRRGGRGAQRHQAPASLVSPRRRRRSLAGSYPAGVCDFPAGASPSALRKDAPAPGNRVSAFRSAGWRCGRIRRPGCLACTGCRVRSRRWRSASLCGRRRCRPAR